MKYYFATMGMRTNLDSMHTLLMLVRYGLDGDEDCSQYVNPDKSFDFLGRHYTADNIDELIEEVDDLAWKGCMGRLTTTEYGRAQSISHERDYMRYCKCMASGMNEKDAALAFMS